MSAIAMMTVAGLAHAQDATQTAQAAPTTGTASAPAVEQIEVTGIRLSLQKSMDIKRNADGITDAVSATDIGQLPDKNIADALQRVPGVNTIQSASAGSGGFGENDRVQIRGTAPTLTQTLIDGHSISTGDWFILDSLSAASRSVSYDLLPVDIVDHIDVVKSPQADLPEGGTAGNVNIVTPSPLSSQFDPITALVRAGGAYNDLAGRAGGQYNAVLGWKNDANTLGFLLVGFHDTRYFRRDGQEELGYGTLPSTATVPGPKDPVTGLPTTIPNPYPTALRGVAYPEIINNALFEQEQVRQGGDAAVEFKPNNHWDFKLDGFYSYLNAGNYNQGDLVDLNEYNGGFGTSAGTYVVPTGYTVKNGILTSATFPGTATHGSPGINDIYRPDAGSSTYFLDGNTTWTPTSNWSIHLQGGYSRGKGQTDQYAYGTTSGTSPNVSYGMNGTNPASLGFSGATGLNDPSNYGAFNGDGNQDWVGDTSLAQLDTDASGQVDVEYMFDSGLISSIKGGVRITEHERNEVESENYGCYSPTCGPTLAAIGNGLFPSNFGNGAGVSTPFTLSVDPNGLAALMKNLVATTGETVSARYYPAAAFKIKENTEAGYLMAKFGNDTFHGNFGVRIASTTDDIDKFDSNPATPSVTPDTGSAFGNYYINHVQQNYTDILPSFAVAYDASKDVVVHFSAGQTVTRPDYYALAGGATLNDTLLSGSQGNPNLKPTRSTNLDVSTEWYYAPESSVSVGLFDMDMRSTFDAGTVQERLVNLSQTQNPATNPAGLANPIYSIYTVTAPTNNSGTSRGTEIAWQQPLMYGFGLAANYTYAQSSQDNPTPGIGGRQLLGAAKHTGNVTAYYQNDLGIDAHLAYSAHSQIYEGIDRANKYFEDDNGELDAHLGYKINSHLSLAYDITNITDATDKYVTTVNNQQVPRANYDFGRTMYLTLTAKY